VQPLFWQHDHALRLHPLPDVLVLGEARPPYSHEHAGMQLLNPGSFARDSAFTFYRPGPRAADVRCRVFQDEGEEGDE
jgi:DNA polymerase epsilon subunit 2